MFAVGDLIMYGSTGVCTVLDVCVPDLPGATRECYILRPHYEANTKVYAPVADNPVPMRPVMTRLEAEELIERLPDIQCLPLDKQKEDLHNLCRNAIRSADAEELARVTKSLHEKKLRMTEQRKILPSTQREYFDQAIKVLHGELAVALQIPVDQVPDAISERLDQPAQERMIS